MSEWNVLSVLSRVLKWYEVHFKGSDDNYDSVKQRAQRTEKQKPRDVNQTLKITGVRVLPGHMVDNRREVSGAVKLNRLKTLVVGFHYTINPCTIWVLRVPVLQRKEEEGITFHDWFEMHSAGPQEEWIIYVLSHWMFGEISSVWQQQPCHK